MTRILGIDPGSRFTGYGIIESDGQHSRYIACGTVKLPTMDLPSKLGRIFEEITEVITTYRPDEMAIEEVFLSRNVNSALKLGQARGAAICAGVTQGLSVAEYTPRLVKQAVVGSGAADKDQVQHMVKILLNLREKLQEDASDALGIALCHAHLRATAERLKQLGA